MNTASAVPLMYPPPTHVAAKMNASQADPTDRDCFQEIATRPISALKQRTGSAVRRASRLCSSLCLNAGLVLNVFNAIDSLTSAVVLRHSPAKTLATLTGHGEDTDKESDVPPRDDYCVRALLTAPTRLPPRRAHSHQQDQGVEDEQRCQTRHVDRHGCLKPLKCRQTTRCQKSTFREVKRFGRGRGINISATSR